MATTQTSSRSENQIRFNWGYWDAANDYTYGREKKWRNGHFDEVYRQGYLAGWAYSVRGEVGESSEYAWEQAVLWGDVTP